VTIAEIRELFTLFDKDGDGYVDIEELGTLIRGLNMNPTEKDIELYMGQVDPEETGSFDINATVSLIASTNKDQNTLEDMLESIRILGAEVGA
jgi:calmodulin